MMNVTPKFQYIQNDSHSQQKFHKNNSNIMKVTPQFNIDSKIPAINPINNFTIPAVIPNEIVIQK
jgi:hypothetical protein